MPHFIQVNLHKAELATVLLGQKLEGRAECIALLTEPHTVAQRITGMPKKTKIICPKNCNTQPRAGILYSSDLHVTALDSLCHRDCAVGLTTINGKRTLLASIYLDIKKSPVPQWLLKLVELAEDKGWAVILGMDSNAHSCLYGPDTNQRGEELEDFILANSLSVENYGQTPTFQINRGNHQIGTHIDVTLSRDLTNPIKDWAVCNAVSYTHLTLPTTPYV